MMMPCDGPKNLATTTVQKLFSFIAFISSFFPADFFNSFIFPMRLIHVLLFLALAGMVLSQDLCTGATCASCSGANACGWCDNGLGASGIGQCLQGSGNNGGTSPSSCNGNVWTYASPGSSCSGGACTAS
jgi:hypothetical protein